MTHIPSPPPSDSKQGVTITELRFLSTAHVPVTPYLLTQFQQITHYSPEDTLQSMPDTQRLSPALKHLYVIIIFKGPEVEDPCFCVV